MTKPQFTQAEIIEAIAARINGEFDNPVLMKFGPLSAGSNHDILEIIKCGDVQKQTYTFEVRFEITAKDEEEAEHLLINEVGTYTENEDAEVYVRGWTIN